MKLLKSLVLFIAWTVLWSSMALFFLCFLAADIKIETALDKILLVAFPWSFVGMVVAVLFLIVHGSRWRAEIDGKDPQGSAGAPH